MGGPASCSSSSEEEDANWRAAIESIATTTAFGGQVFGSTFINGSATHPATLNKQKDDGKQTQNPQKLKHYQIKAQKLLDQILERTLETVRNPIHVLDDDSIVNEGGVRLFKRSPVGIVFDCTDEIQCPRKKPRILPGEEVDENSKKFKKRIRSVAVDGADIIAAARAAGQKSLARFEAKEAASKEKAKKEEERVAELKRIRGERWLPCIAKEMQLNKHSK